jgi:hypothetical protein
MPWEVFRLLSWMSRKKVFFQAGLKWIYALTLLFILCPGVAGALELTVSPTGANNDQTIINNALEAVYNSGGGKVYLNAGTYEVDNTVIIRSNTILTGSQDAVIRVSSSSSLWFTGRSGVISNNELVNNVEIYGFSINGNIQNLPESFSHTRPDTAHDTENLIRLQGDSNNFMDNIKVHDMRLFDSFGDGCHIIYCKNAQVNNNFISNTQHEGIFWSVVTDSELYNNQIAGITSDCARLDNCINCKVHENVLFSYTGDHNAGEWEKGENGLQLGDGGVSHGYDARKAPTSTANIEVFGNTFAANGLQAILLGAAALASSANVFIHDNKFIGKAELETSGISFDISSSNPSTIDRSAKVFSSIFDILKQDFNFQYPDIQVPINASVSVSEYNNSYNPHSLIYVDGDGLTSIKYEYGENSTTHYYLINGGKSDVWTGDLQHKGCAVYLPGRFEARNLRVTCFNSQGYRNITNFNITEVSDNSSQVLNPNLWAFPGTLAILGISIYRNARRVIKW